MSPLASLSKISNVCFEMSRTCVFLQRKAQQLNAQRQLEEAFESRLHQMQASIQTMTLGPADDSLSTDSNTSTGLSVHGFTAIQDHLFVLTAIFLE